ncbi:MAG: hypothetical protein ACRDZZ_07270 [Ilumatobacteraceae bacterium]
MSRPPDDVGGGVPAHPEADDSDPAARRSGMSWTTVVTLVLLGALLVTIVVLHLTGVVGPAGHG